MALIRCRTTEYPEQLSFCLLSWKKEKLSPAAFLRKRSSLDEASLGCRGLCCRSPCVRSRKMSPGKGQPESFSCWSQPVASVVQGVTAQKNWRISAVWKSALWSRICLGSKMAAALLKTEIAWPKGSTRQEWVFCYEVSRISWCSWC